MLNYAGVRSFGGYDYNQWPFAQEEDNLWDNGSIFAWYCAKPDPIVDQNNILIRVNDQSAEGTRDSGGRRKLQ